VEWVATGAEGEKGQEMAHQYRRLCLDFGMEDGS